MNEDGNNHFEGLEGLSVSAHPLISIGEDVGLYSSIQSSYSA